jgi:hypothetical protein
MASRKNVPAARVREWAATPEGSKALTEAGAKFPGKRGRLDPSTLTVFHKENKGLRYETASEAEKPTITVKVPAKDSRGRTITKSMTVTTEYARSVLGHPAGRRGRFDRAALAEALAATV